jgi:hypothetical protein
MEPRRDPFKEIERGEWTNIFLGPEMIMHKRFGNLLRTERFTRLFRYFAIDEAHLVLEWAEFRSAFLEIQQLRNRFEAKVVWLALSATVEPTKEFPKLVKLLGYDLRRATVIRLPVDRHNIAFAPRFLKHSVTGTEFLDFAWAVPLGATRVTDIPITVIFVNTIKQVTRLKAYLTRLLPDTLDDAIRNQVVMSISGMMSSGHNTGAVNSVRSGGNARVLVCTDAGALGIDVSQVQQVAILVEKDATYRMLCQKMGRIRTKGVAILYFHQWMRDSKTNPTDVSQRSEVEPVIVELANSSVERCPRAVNVGYWGDVIVPFDDTLHPCCNLHHPDLDTTHLKEVQQRAETAKATVKALKEAQQGALRSDRTHSPPDEAVMQPIARQMICSWRQVNLQQMVGYKTHMTFSVILPDSLVNLLAKRLHLCTDIERFRTVMSSWTRLDEWGESLFELVNKIWAAFESELVAKQIKEEQERRKRERQEKANNKRNTSREDPPDNHVPETQIKKARLSMAKAGSRAKPRAGKSGSSGKGGKN